ncbi:MAG: hypothetical protein ACRC8A_09535 [Microcoleaceae cyanobacterium]
MVSQRKSSGIFQVCLTTAIALSSFGLLTVIQHSPAVAQEREGCFIILSSGQSQNLNGLCASIQSPTASPKRPQTRRTATTENAESGREVRQGNLRNLRYWIFTNDRGQYWAKVRDTRSPEETPITKVRGGSDEDVMEKLKRIAQIPEEQPRNRDSENP